MCIRDSARTLDCIQRHREEKSERRRRRRRRERERPSRQKKACYDWINLINNRIVHWLRLSLDNSFPFDHSAQQFDSFNCHPYRWKLSFLLCHCLHRHLLLLLLPLLVPILFLFFYRSIFSSLLSFTIFHRWKQITEKMGEREKTSLPAHTHTHTLTYTKSFSSSSSLFLC